MVQIDDAGSGSFVGGTCIGMYRPETNDYFFDIIPVALYDPESFKNKLYLDEVVRIISSGLGAFDVSRSETIEICRGYMFERLKQWLDSEGYSWYCTHITGRIQDIVEKNFELYTQRLGLPELYIKYTRYPFHFHKLLRWVYADYENRIKLCKVGWKSWRKLEDAQPELSWGVMRHRGLPCLKCGNPIKYGSDIKILKISGDRDNYVYMHTDC